MSDKLVIKFNEDDLTLGDLEDFEDKVGVALFDAIKPKPVLGEDGRPERDEKGRPVTEVQLSSKALIGIVWITERGKRPDFSWDDARRVKVSHIEWGSDEPVEPGKDPAEAPVAVAEAPVLVEAVMHG